ncbi:MAG: hypothetical protein HN350_17955 [Phycisphaerales bacterium]|jgi:hypothetical protein|nr:hypothetical protein [Phycisphaerales bacterium]
MCVAASLLLAHYLTMSVVVTAPSCKAFVGCLFVLVTWTVIGWAAWTGWPFTIQILSAESGAYSIWNIAIAAAGCLAAPVSMYNTLRAVKKAQQREELEEGLRGPGFSMDNDTTAALMAASGMITRQQVSGMSDVLGKLRKD